MTAAHSLSWDPSLAHNLLRGFPPARDQLLPILQCLQTAFGSVPEEAKSLVAEHLNISLAEVHGVITFYHDFRIEPPAKLVVRVCRAEACQAAGGREVARALLDHFRLEWNKPSADRSLCIEPVYCLGLCAAAPAALIGDLFTADFTAEELIAQVEAAR